MNPSVKSLITATGFGLSLTALPLVAMAQTSPAVVNAPSLESVPANQPLFLSPPLVSCNLVEMPDAGDSAIGGNALLTPEAPCAGQDTEEAAMASAEINEARRGEPEPAPAPLIGEPLSINLGGTQLNGARGDGSVVGAAVLDGPTDSEPDSMENLAEVHVGDDPQDGRADNLAQLNLLDGETHVVSVTAGDAGQNELTTASGDGIDAVAHINIGGNPDAGNDPNLLQVTLFDGQEMAQPPFEVIVLDGINGDHDGTGTPESEGAVVAYGPPSNNGAPPPEAPAPAPATDEEEGNPVTDLIATLTGEEDQDGNTDEDDGNPVTDLIATLTGDEDEDPANDGETENRETNGVGGGDAGPVGVALGGTPVVPGGGDDSVLALSVLGGLDQEAEDGGITGWSNIAQITVGDDSNEDAETCQSFFGLFERCTPGGPHRPLDNNALQLNVLDGAAAQVAQVSVGDFLTNPAMIPSNVAEVIVGDDPGEGGSRGNGNVLQATLLDGAINQVNPSDDYQQVAALTVGDGTEFLVVGALTQQMLLDSAATVTVGRNPDQGQENNLVQLTLLDGIVSDDVPALEVTVLDGINGDAEGLDMLISVTGSEVPGNNGNNGNGNGNNGNNGNGNNGNNGNGNGNNGMNDPTAALTALDALFGDGAGNGTPSFPPSVPGLDLPPNGVPGDLSALPAPLNGVGPEQLLDALSALQP